MCPALAGSRSPCLHQHPDSRRASSKVSYDTVAGVVRQTDALTSDGRLAHIRPQATSSPRVLSILAPVGTSHFRVTVHGSAIYRLTVPEIAPQDWPASVEQDSRTQMLANSGWVGNAMYITFCPPAAAYVSNCVAPTAEDRQAVVDAIDGELVGGSALGPTGMYYVRFPIGPGKPGEAVLHALSIVRTLPHVWLLILGSPDRLAKPAYLGRRMVIGSRHGTQPCRCGQR